jgi:hypothetical protein
MRGTLIPILTVVVIITSIYNAVNIAAIGSPGLLAWGLVFSVGVPVIAIVHAWYLARSETGPAKLRPSALILSGVLFAQAALMPFAEQLRQARADASLERQ